MQVSSFGDNFLHNIYLSQCNRLSPYNLNFASQVTQHNILYMMQTELKILIRLIRQLTSQSNVSQSPVPTYEMFPNQFL